MTQRIRIQSVPPTLHADIKLCSKKLGITINRMVSMKLYEIVKNGKLCEPCNCQNDKEIVIRGFKKIEELNKIAEENGIPVQQIIKMALFEIVGNSTFLNKKKPA